jgi:hypothetical protein
MVLVGVVDGAGLLFFLPYVLGKLLLDVEELDKVVNNIVENLVLIDSDIFFLLFRHRLGRFGFGLSSEELDKLANEAVDFFADSHDLFTSLCNFDELGFGITVKLTSLLDVLNQPCGQQAQADRVNF